MLTDSSLAISPLDGRYQQKTSSLSLFFSEAALIFSRIKIECRYLVYLAKFGVIRALSVEEKKLLLQLGELDLKNAARVKEIEGQTHHDVKAIEYFLREKLAKTSLADLTAYIHFGITSEDINNLAYRTMLLAGLKTELDSNLRAVLTELTDLAERYVALPMLARTHGQPAIPTTLGKELAVFGSRLVDLLSELEEFKFKGKFSGAVGGYQAMILADPEIDWLKLSQELVESLDLEWQEVTTQISPADDLVKLFSIFQRLNLILLDLNQDVWRYISDGWLVQKGKEEFVGSSTMPQKINPIEFENSEGNLVLANALFEGMSRKLPISRLQRDLSESTILRSMGSAFAYNLLALKSLADGLSKLAADEAVIKKTLNSNYNILAEAWQTLARKIGDDSAYEKVAVLAKNKVWSKSDWQEMTAGAPSELKQLSPENYLGLSSQIASQAIKKTRQFLNQYQFSQRKLKYDQQV